MTLEHDYEPNYWICTHKPNWNSILAHNSHKPNCQLKLNFLKYISLKRSAISKLELFESMVLILLQSQLCAPWQSHQHSNYWLELMKKPMVLVVGRWICCAQVGMLQVNQHGWGWRVNDSPAAPGVNNWHWSLLNASSYHTIHAHGYWLSTLVAWWRDSTWSSCRGCWISHERQQPFKKYKILALLFLGLAHCHYGVTWTE